MQGKNLNKLKIKLFIPTIYAAVIEAVKDEVCLLRLLVK